MVKKISEGHEVIQAHKKTGSDFAGWQPVCELDRVREGCADDEVRRDRATQHGGRRGWIATLPSGRGSTRFRRTLRQQNIDWDRFLGNAPKRPFEPIRLFRWRNYSDYGTGSAGDLFVHLLTGLHVVTGSIGPTRIYSCGGTRFWKDGRDAPDVMLGVLDYPKTDTHPEFTFSIRVNLACGNVTESFGFRFVGSEGQMTVGLNGLTLAKVPRETEPGYTIDTFPEKVREEFLRKYRQEHPPQAVNADSIRAQSEMKFNAPRNHSAHLEHHRNFYNAVRTESRSSKTRYSG